MGLPRGIAARLDALIRNETGMVGHYGEVFSSKSTFATKEAIGTPGYDLEYGHNFNSTDPNKWISKNWKTIKKKAEELGIESIKFETGNNGAAIIKATIPKNKEPLFRNAFSKEYRELENSVDGHSEWLRDA